MARHRRRPGTNLFAIRREGVDVSLNDNPIFLTQKRLVHRGGVLAAILIAALIGCSLLAGLIAYVANPIHFNSFGTVQDAGETFYGWTIGVEILVLVVGSAARITNVLANERKAGLWDSNRLTPLAPSRLIVGYWLGAPLREFYMGAVLASIGLFVVFIGRLPLMFWLGTQILIFSTTLLFGLLSVLFGLVFQRPQGGIIFLVLLFLVQMFSAAMPKFFLTGFLLPTYSLVNLFVAADPSTSPYHQNGDWTGSPEIFGLPVYPILLTVALQAILGVFLWRMALRKATSPFQSTLLRWEAIAIFAIFVFVQHGLMWGVWHGKFPEAEGDRINGMGSDTPFLSIVHAGTLFLTVVVLALVSPQPESIRLKALRQGIKSPMAIFPQSSLSLALALTAVVAVILFTHFVFSFAGSGETYFIAVGNLLAFSVIFSLLLEICRLHYRRRALGFLALWIFIACVLPFIAAGVFGDSTYAQFSLLSPGCIALNPPGFYPRNINDPSIPLIITVAHLFIAIVLSTVWWGGWKKLLARAV
jgi:hypothetical protein